MRLGAIAMLAGAVALAVYLRTVAPALPTGDSEDLITAARVLGIAHPPGYPLYTMLGHLVGLLPLGSAALRVDLLSALLHAATVGLVCLLIYRLLGPDDRPFGKLRPGLRAGWMADGELQSSAVGRRSSVVDPAVAAAVGGLLLGFSTAYWRYATVAEVFPLNSFFAALLLLLLLEWERRPERAGLLWAFGLGSGLAAANHHTIALLAPACLVLLWSGARRLLPRAGAWESGRVGEAPSPALPLSPWVSRRPTPARVLGVAMALLLLGLLPYLYLPLAAAQDPPLRWGDPATLDGFLRHVTRADYGSFRLSPQEQGPSPLEPLGLLVSSLFEGFRPLGCLLAVAGAWWLARNRPIQGLALLLAFLLTGPAFIAYANPNITHPQWKGVLERFYILPSLPLAVAAGAGAFQVLLWVRRLAQRIAPTWQAGFFAGLALLALPLGSIGAHLAEADHSDNFVAQYYGQDLLSPLEPGALLITEGDNVTFPVEYLQLVEGYRRDVIGLSMEKLTYPWYVQQQRRLHPDLVIPFEIYDLGQTSTIQSLVEANLPSRPVYILAVPKEPGFWEASDVVRAGFAEKLEPKGSQPDRYAILREKTELFRQLHYPTRVYPDYTRENVLGRIYGRLALDVGNVLSDDGRLPEAMAMYRTVIRLVPDFAPTYKRLGLMLLRQGTDVSEVPALWEEYLRLNPGDADAPAMRQQIEAIRGKR